jgi:hypothetical protein
MPTAIKLRINDNPFELRRGASLVKPFELRRGASLVKPFELRRGASLVSKLIHQCFETA